MTGMVFSRKWFRTFDVIRFTTCHQVSPSFTKSHQDLHQVSPNLARFQFQYEKHMQNHSNNTFSVCTNHYKTLFCIFKTGKPGQVWWNLVKFGETWPLAKFGETWPSLVKPGVSLVKPGETWRKPGVDLVKLGVWPLSSNIFSCGTEPERWMHKLQEK